MFLQKHNFNGETTYDKLGRLGISTPTTRSLVVMLRAQKFFSSTSESDVNDLRPISENQKKSGKTTSCYQIYCTSWGLCVSQPPALCMASGHGPQFVFTGPGPSFVFISPGLQFVFTGPGPSFVFIGPGLQFVFTGPGPQFVFTGPGPHPRLVFTSPGQDFTTTTTTNTIYY